MTSTLQPLGQITLQVSADTVARTLTALQAAIDLCDGEGRKSVFEVRDKAAEAQMLLVNVIGDNAGKELHRGS